MTHRHPRNPAVTPAQLELLLPDEGVPDRVLHPALGDAQAVIQLLEDWHAAGWVQQLDLRFARFLHAEAPDAPALLLLAAALASHQLGRGHVCLDLAATLLGPGRVLNLPPELRRDPSDSSLITPAELLATLSLAHWEAAMQSSAVSDGSRVAPLVHDGGRLYLYRYWRYEQRVARGVADRVQALSGVDAGDERRTAHCEGKETDIPSAARVRAMLDVLFGPAVDSGALDWQRLACALAVRRRFSIVTGGPGTGKTTTVVRLLALLQALHFESSGSVLRIQLAAPTGKAAARLSESVAAKVSELPFDRLPGAATLAAAIPSRVTTLHRLLGGRPHVQTRRYNAENPLPLDVLVVDEASMVSLSDMAHVMAALPAKAQLVLIGDKDQLSSVEAGAVLGELCRRAETGHYLPATAKWLEQATGEPLPAQMIDPDGKTLDQAVAMLRVSHRFDEGSGIGKLASAVNQGRAEDVLALLTAPPVDLAYLRVSDSRRREFERLVVEGGPSSSAETRTDADTPRRGYGHYLSLANNPPSTDDPSAFDAWAAAVLQAQRACQMLCVLRAGPWGVEGRNHAIARILHAQGLIPALAGWYAGRPVMVTRNSPALRLTNGDIGVVLPYPAGGSQGRALRVAFPDGEGSGVRWYAPNRLDHVETVFALTVHKSQGSEFHHAILVLPAAPTPVLTRELVYTGITRASRWFTLVNPGPESLLRQAVGQRVYRSGGLGDVLDALR